MMISFTPHRKMFAALAFALCAGCAATPTTPEPDAMIAQAYPDIGTDGGDASIANLAWEDFIAHDGLRETIRQALANNRDLKIAIARVEEADAAFRLSGASLLPDIGGVGSLTRGRTPEDLSFSGRASTSSQYQLGASARWEIDFWGRLHNLRASALENYLATQEAQRAVATSLLVQVANTYLAVRETDERIALAEKTVMTRTESLRIVRRQYEVGAGSKLAVTQAQTVLGQTRAELQALNQARTQLINALSLLVGQPAEVAPGALAADRKQFQRPLPAGLPSDLLLNRPDLRAAEHRLAASDANIAAARAAFFPQVSLTGFAGAASADLDGLFDAGSGAWTFSPSITLPIFNAGRNQASLDIAVARRNAAVADYERTIQSAFREVADALAQRRWLAERIATTESTRDALTERLRLAELRYASGRSAYLEVLDAQRDLFATEQLLVQLQRAHLSSGVNLYAALGGGFPDQTNNILPESQTIP